MEKFVLKNSSVEFNKKIKLQIFGTAICTKCVLTYACIFMDQVKTDLLETQKDKPFLQVRYIDNIFFIWTHDQEQLNLF